MCGIAGILSSSPLPPAARTALDAMTSAVHHRGPDSKGSFHANEEGVLLGHQRLAIVDPSASGSQPMQSSDGRFVINFNGEIYNHRTLRRRLDRQASGIWRGGSDTEVLLATIETLGLDAALDEIRGMYAFSLYDREQGVAHLVRDRFGEKPLYFCKIGRDTLVFGSELSCLERHPGFRRTIDQDALAHYFRFGYIPAPQSIYRDVFKLRPGHLLSIPLKDLARLPNDEDLLSSARRYWPRAKANPAERNAPGEFSADDYRSQVETALREAITSQLCADVPVGIFLSSGIDSTTITALACEIAGKPLPSFTLGIDDATVSPLADSADESTHAAKIATYLGTQHHEVRVDSQMVARAARTMGRVYDEPFADSSQLLSTLLAESARAEVKVCLAGDGADELFGGYNRHVWIHNNWAGLHALPDVTRRLGAGVIRHLNSNALERVYANVHGALPRRLRVTDLGAKLDKVAAALSQNDLWAVYRQLATRSDERLVRTSKHEQKHPLRVRADGAGVLRPHYLAKQRSPAEQFMAWDIEGYLAGDILTKLDRASMHYGLETRLPYLDGRVSDVAARLPVSAKFNRHQGKRVLREILARRIPERLIARPKTGFSVPLDQWLRTSLRGFAEDQLAPERLDACDCLDGDKIRTLWREHQRGSRNHGDAIWHVLMFSAWMSRDSTG